MSSPDVVLLRSPDDPDPYLQAFREAGCTAVCEPVLRFTFPHQEALRQHLQRTETYEGLIATSPRTGRALHEAFRTAPRLRAHWQGRPAYVVGPKTGRWMQKLGLDTRGENAGSATALVEVIREEAPTGRLLFLTGNRRREALPDGLRTADISFSEQIVYKTHPRSTLDLPPSSHRPWLVFFSPSGLEAVEAEYNSIPSNYRLAAIGPTTAGALRDAGRERVVEAKKPTPDALVEAVVQADAEE